MFTNYLKYQIDLKTGNLDSFTSFQAIFQFQMKGFTSDPAIVKQVKFKMVFSLWHFYSIDMNLKLELFESNLEKPKKVLIDSRNFRAMLTSLDQNFSQFILKVFQLD